MFLLSASCKMFVYIFLFLLFAILLFFSFFHVCPALLTYSLLYLNLSLHHV